MDLDSARDASKQGAYAAFAYAVLILVGIGARLWLGNGEATQNNFAAQVTDPLVLLDVGIVVVLGFLMLRYSRVAALLMLSYFLFDQVLLLLERSSAGNIVLKLVFLYFFGNAIRGTFAYHRRRADEDPSYRSIRVYHFLVGAPPAVIFMGLMGLVIADEAGLIPDVENTQANSASGAPKEPEFSFPPSIAGDIGRSGVFTNVLSPKSDAPSNKDAPSPTHERGR